jgi:uncharacterized ferritin-like protein (DUF455 family)
MSRSITDVREFCLGILESGDLDSKLRSPRDADGAFLEDRPAEPTFIDRPARSGPLVFRRGSARASGRLPALHELRLPSARAACLERFANHELMAVELFAWALLAHPQMPRALRRGYLRVLEEEQRHLRLYLERLAAAGSGLGDSRLSDYFWQQVPAIRDSADGVVTFLCVMGLTFEQANLDYTGLYRDAFRDAGDEESARSLEQVHEDEIGHVRLAAVWLDRLRGGSRSDVEAYTAAIPFPLSAARAKGRKFDAAARRRAGLSEELIELVRSARPYERGGRNDAAAESKPDRPPPPEAGP